MDVALESTGYELLDKWLILEMKLPDGKINSVVERVFKDENEIVNAKVFFRTRINGEVFSFEDYLSTNRKGNYFLSGKNEIQFTLRWDVFSDNTFEVFTDREWVDVYG